MTVSAARKQQGLSLLAAAGTVLAVLGTAAGRAPVPLLLAACLPLAVVAAAAAVARPLAALAVGAAVVVLVPFYDGRYVSGALGITPMSAVCLVLLPAALSARGRVRLQPLDLAVAGLVALRAGGLFVDGYGVGAPLGTLLGVGLPYAVFRLLTTEPGAPRVLAGVLVAGGAALSLVAVGERAGDGNPFFTLLPGQYQVAQWARPELRFGAVRAEASFGHPIAFGMFLALVLVLAVALALTVDSLALRLLLFAAAGLSLYGLTATLSRGPLLAAVVGLVVWLVLTGRRLDVLRLAAVTAAVAVVVVSTPVLGLVQDLVNSSSGDTAEARSAEYRLQIFDVVRDPGQFSLLGQQAGPGEGISDVVRERTGLKSLDSEYALVFLQTGALSVLVFVVVGGLVVAVAVRRGLTPVDRAWAVGLAASYLNLITVALLTQEAELFWAGTAVVAGIAQRAPARRRDPAAVEPRPREVVA